MAHRINTAGVVVQKCSTGMERCDIDHKFTRSELEMNVTTIVEYRS